MSDTAMDIEGQRRHTSASRPFGGSLHYFISKGRRFLVKHKRPSAAIFFFVLEAISVVVDELGKSRLGYLLAAFLLSVLGFAVTTYALIKEKNSKTLTRRRQAEKQLSITDIVFSVAQLIITFIHFILAAFGLKINFSASVLPLAFAAIVVVFAFKRKEDFGKEQRELKWAHAQRTLHGLSPPDDTEMFTERTNELNQMAEEAKRRAEIARLRELLTLKDHVESVVRLKGLDIDSFQQAYSV